MYFIVYLYIIFSLKKKIVILNLKKKYNKNMQKKHKNKKISNLQQNIFMIYAKICIFKFHIWYYNLKQWVYFAHCYILQ